MFGQVARSSELCGLKYYDAQQYPSIPITICRTLHLLTKINFVSLRTSPDKIRATWQNISGDLTLILGDLTGFQNYHYSAY